MSDGPTSTPYGELRPGDVLGPYRLQEQIGEGGMAVVFRGIREADGAVVALKFLKPTLAGNDVYRRRFAHEARSASVRHPNLVPVYDHGELDGRPFIAAEYAPARTLEERIAGEGPLPLADVLRVAGDLSGALKALHDAELVHRDVKSANVLLRGDGTAVLGDLGLARGRGYTALTKPGQMMGTLEYVAPELIRGEEATPASDVYALGCTVYETLVGQTPFGGQGPLRVGMAHLDEPPPDPSERRPDCPPAVARAVLLALAKDPNKRPYPATSYARALRTAAG